MRPRDGSDLSQVPQLVSSWLVLEPRLKPSFIYLLLFVSIVSAGFQLNAAPSIWQKLLGVLCGEQFKNEAVVGY